MIRRSAPGLAVLGLAILAGWLAEVAHLPMAWVLGPMLVTAAGSVAGLQVFSSNAGRRLGQLLIGATMGLGITGAMLAHIVPWLPLMVLSALAMIALAGFVSVFFARAARIEEDCAFYALLPGGLSEMANMAGRNGVDPEPIALVQALRVFLVVCMIPPLALFGQEAGAQSLEAVAGIALTDLAMVLCCAALVAWLALRAGLSNSWTLGGILAGIVLGASGLVSGATPEALFHLAQFLIGIVIGARFQRAMLMRLPRIAIMGMMALLVLILMALLAAWLASLALPFSTTELMLMISPGGLTEMAVAAKALHLDLTAVVGFHVVRSLLVNGLAARLLIWIDFCKVRSLARRLLHSARPRR